MKKLSLSILDFIKMWKKHRWDKRFFQNDFKKASMKIKKVFLLNAMMLFQIRNAIVSMFKNGFINP